jgi:hypothetical protein
MAADAAQGGVLPTAGDSLALPEQYALSANWASFVQRDSGVLSLVADGPRLPAFFVLLVAQATRRQPGCTGDGKISCGSIAAARQVSIPGSVTGDVRNSSKRLIWGRPSYLDEKPRSVSIGASEH